ncbi:MAG: alkene reductase [Rickettsiales bacterium]|nr:alkene reductase [Rickettsiales bacterium]
MSDLFSSAALGPLTLPHRIMMAPLTRSRADDATDVPSEMAITYYEQRAGASLIIAEATQINPEGKGYIRTPGIYDDAQVKQWKKITDVVHTKKGRIFLQLWHVGRISHTSFQPDGKQPLAPSAIRADVDAFTNDGKEPCSEPRAMTQDDITRTVADYKKAAQLAKDAGFDGVEVHAANGYLINQFLSDGSNHRDDAYGGNDEARAKFLFDVMDAVLSVWDSNCVGIRLSPTGTFNDVSQSDPLAQYSYVIEKLNTLDLAYLHFVERFPGIDVSNEDLAIVNDLRQQWKGFYIANGDYDFLKAKQAVESGHADAVTFGRPYIANPDLAERFKQGAELNEPDHDTFYGGGAEGYIDYPFLGEKKQDAA